VANPPYPKTTVSRRQPGTRQLSQASGPGARRGGRRRWPRGCSRVGGGARPAESPWRGSARRARLNGGSAVRPAEAGSASGGASESRPPRRSRARCRRSGPRPPPWGAGPGRPGPVAAGPRAPVSRRDPRRSGPDAPAGGVIPVARGWLRNEIADWPGVLSALGGVPVGASTSDPDADFGPAIARGDAPELFTEVGDAARRLGARPPEQVRLSYLPCCGVVAWGRSRALMLGLPLLHVLTRAELRAVLAHELAHLARGDATAAASCSRFVQGLAQALDAAPRAAWGPLGLWARVCRRVAEALHAPIALGQEARADRASAAIAGGDAAASALVKGRGRPGPVPRGPGCLRPVGRRRPEPLQLLPTVLGSPARAPDHVDPSSHPERGGGRGRPRASAPARPDRGRPGLSSAPPRRGGWAAGHLAPGGPGGDGADVT
jgi:hypothetical protein